MTNIGIHFSAIPCERLSPSDRPPRSYYGIHLFTPCFSNNLNDRLQCHQIVGFEKVLPDSSKYSPNLATEDMMGLMGTPQQPIDFTVAGGCQNVLDLRKIRVKEERADDRPPRVTCYPATPCFGHRADSSEDGYSERGSVSPPSLSSPASAFSITGSIISGSVTRNGKPTRPFKAYPKNPLSLPVVSTAEAILGHASTEAYAEFRRKMLSQVHAVSGGGSVSNPKMKRSVSPQQSGQAPEGDGKDAAYWERRRRNNEAAKRSRDARRAKEDEIAIRAAFLEQENIQLKYENATLRNEAAKLRCLLYNR